MTAPSPRHRQGGSSKPSGGSKAPSSGKPSSKPGGRPVPGKKDDSHAKASHHQGGSKQARPGGSSKGGKSGGSAKGATQGGNKAGGGSNPKKGGGSSKKSGSKSGGGAQGMAEAAAALLGIGGFGGDDDGAEAPGEVPESKWPRSALRPGKVCTIYSAPNPPRWPILSPTLAARYDLASAFTVRVACSSG